MQQAGMVVMLSLLVLFAKVWKPALVEAANICASYYLQN
jgi:hypothetical protein